MLLPKVLYYVYFPPPMSPGPSLGILTLLIISWGPNLKIKSVMTGLTINNYSKLKTLGGELGLFLQFYKLSKYKRICNVTRC